MTSIGFVNPQAQAIVLEINILAEDRITKITSYKNSIPTITKLEGLQFNITGILKEFPDLKGKEHPEMKRIALRRFKEHIRKFNKERDLILYLIDDLKKHGYECKQFIKQGFRPMPIEKYLKNDFL